MFVSKLVFLTTILISFIFMPVFLFSQNNPVLPVDSSKTKIALFQLENNEHDVQIEVISNHVVRTIELNLGMMGKYAIMENSLSEYSTTPDWLLKYCDDKNLDNIIFGKAVLNELTGSVNIEISVFDKVKNAITIKKSAQADTIFDIFNTSTQISLEILEGISGMSLAFGGVKFINTGDKGNYSIYIDNIFAGHDLENISAMIEGKRNIKITQARMFERYALFDSDVVITNGKITEITFSIPGFLKNEGEEIRDEETVINKRINDKYFTKKVRESFTKLFQLLGETTYSKTAADKKAEVEKSFAEWEKNREEWGLKADEDLTSFDKPYSVSLYGGFVGSQSDYNSESTSISSTPGVDKNSTSPVVGISFTYSLPYNFALLLRVQYTHPDFIYSLNSGDKRESFVLELPVYIGYTFGKSKIWSIYAGGFLGICEERENDESNNFTIDTPYNLFVFGISGGMKYEIPIFSSSFIEIGIQYAAVLTNMLDSDTENLKYNYINFTAGYGIKF